MTFQSLSLMSLVTVLLAVWGCQDANESLPAAAAAEAHYIDAGDSLPRVAYANGDVSINDRCPVRKNKLNLRLAPIYVNGHAVGFC